MTDETIPESQVASDPDHRLLRALVGHWHTSGRTYASYSAPSAEIEATDTYEWLPRGLGLFHTVDSCETRLSESGGELIWTMQSESDRFTGVFDDDGTTISGCWELRGADGRWRLRMEITLTKTR
jgi:hypothetical protein